MTLPTSEVLETAADIVEAGWLQGDMHSADGTQHCAVGGIECAVHRLQHRLGPFSTSREALAARGEATVLASMTLDDLVTDDDELTSVPRWNDANGRTQQEVVDAMRKAAKLARIREESA
jgi:hypothetical protein